ncbi:hypothetical protein VNI00_011534 [Paramarasmius palmivorus]|uniref:Uncharacterized protein n=1 Tax=Paramarasmius palmivorus TaxID=297713 RepID=A0AAW0CFY8_9AGAR
MDETHFPRLGESAYHILNGQPSFDKVWCAEPEELLANAKSARINNTMQVHLSFMDDQQWDRLRHKLLHTKTVVSGTTGLGCWTTPDFNAPFELFTYPPDVEEIGGLVMDFGYNLSSNLPLHLRPKDSARAIATELSYSNTVYANKSPYTPTVDNDVHVANVLNFENGLKQTIQLVVSNTTPMGLVFAMKSTLYMNVITAWDMLMAYPYSTLEQRQAFDATLPQAANMFINNPCFDGQPILVNPPQVAPDVVTSDNEKTILPRSFGDFFTAKVTLPYIGLSCDRTLPGSRESVAANTWQARNGQNNTMIVESLLYRSPLLAQSYQIAPTVNAVLAQNSPSSWSMARPADFRPLSYDDDLFITLAETALQDIWAPGSPYNIILGRIRENVLTWSAQYCHFPARLVPSPAVSCVAFRALSNLRAGLEDRTKTHYLYKPTSHGVPVWTTLIIVVPNPSSSEDQTESSAGLTQVFEGLDSISMTLIIKFFDGTMSTPPLTNDLVHVTPVVNLLKVLHGVMEGSLSVEDADILDGLGAAESSAVDGVVVNLVKKTYLSRFVETHYQLAVDNPQAVKSLPTMTVVCQNCKHVVNLPPPDSRWYCVARGLRIGYIKGWENVKKLVLFVADNKYAAHSSKSAARKAFVFAVANREAAVTVTEDVAMAYDPVPINDGFLYP